MLSLVLGSEVTDASVAAIASSYLNLELLDLSGGVFIEKRASPNEWQIWMESRS